MKMVYDRKAYTTTTSEESLSGTYGQISFGRLCDLLEKCGEVNLHETITHLVIENGMIRYRVDFVHDTTKKRVEHEDQH